MIGVEASTFLDHANLVAVVHNGTCWAACISGGLDMGPNGIVQVADLTIAMAEDELLPQVVLQWIKTFKAEFDKFCVAPPTKKFMPSYAYVTTPVLQAYSTKYGICFIMTNIPVERGYRRAVNVIDVIIPEKRCDVFTTLVFKVEGNRFDYYMPKEGHIAGFDRFISESVMVCCTYVLAFLDYCVV